MDINNLSDLPDWDDEKLSSFNDDEGEGWKPNPTRDLCKKLYKQWQQVIFLLRGVLDPFAEMEESEDDFLQVTSSEMLQDAYITALRYEPRNPEAFILCAWKTHRSFANWHKGSAAHYYYFWQMKK